MGTNKKVTFLLIVQVDFLLTNLGPANSFSVLARESLNNGFVAAVPGGERRGDRFGFGFGGDGDGDFVNFPNGVVGVPWLTGLSELKPRLEREETRNVALTLAIPRSAQHGDRKIVNLEVQPFGEGEGDEVSSRRFYFAVNDPSVRGIDVDEKEPVCK